MDAYHKSLELEKWADSVIIPNLQNKGWVVERLHEINSNPTYETCGDLRIKKGDKVCIVELKAEEVEETGNFFMETWSHKKIGRKGWFRTCKAEYLLYIFKDTGNFYKMTFDEIRDFVSDNTWRYREVLQQKHKQENDTWGYCIPINTLRKQLRLFKKENIND